MKEFLKTNIDERPGTIILGILTLYFLITGFILYLFFLHRLTIIAAITLILTVTLIYLPRFFIIKKLQTKDKIEIINEYLLINGVGINFSEILDYKVNEKKPQVVFFINNKMIVFYEAEFRLRLKTEEVSFTAVGSEKIKLLTEFFSQIVK